MTEAPKAELHSYIVVLSFADPGPLTVGSWLAPDPASAAALATAKAVREHAIEAPLQTCLVVEETAEMLRYRLRMIEGGKAGEVVSLVHNEPGAGIFGQRGVEMLHDRTATTCHHGTPLDQQCARCRMDQNPAYGTCPHGAPVGHCTACTAAIEQARTCHHGTPHGLPCPHCIPDTIPPPGYRWRPDEQGWEPDPAA